MDSNDWNDGSCSWDRKVVCQYRDDDDILGAAADAASEDEEENLAQEIERRLGPKYQPSL